MIWLRTDERIEKEEQLELKKCEAKVSRERDNMLFDMLADIRQIQLSQIPFKDKNDLNVFLTRLPSYRGNAKKDQEKRRWKVTQRMPGEIPEWKKQKMKEQENTGEPIPKSV